MKHSKQLEESKANSAAAIKELEHLQNEKRKMLMEHETAKLKELDESYSKEFTEWKSLWWYCGAKENFGKIRKLIRRMI